MTKIFQFQKNSKKKKSKSREKFGNLVNTEWASETPKTLWKKILEEIKTHFDYTLDRYVGLKLSQHIQ